MKTEIGMKASANDDNLPTMKEVRLFFSVGWRTWDNPEA